MENRTKELISDLQLFIFNKTGKQVELNHKYDSTWKSKLIPVSTRELGLFDLVLNKAEMEVSLWFDEDQDEARLSIQFWYHHVGGGSNGCSTTYYFKVNGFTSICLVLTGQN